MSPKASSSRKSRLQLDKRLEKAESLQRCGWPACEAACCVYGTWVDEGEVDRIRDAAEQIKPHLSAEHGDPELWFEEEREGDDFTPRGTVLHTRVIGNPSHYGGSACIFLREDYRCGLQVAGESAGKHPWHYKPFYCILHPLDLDQGSRITLDEPRFLTVEKASCLPRIRPGCASPGFICRGIGLFEKKGLDRWINCAHS